MIPAFAKRRSQATIVLTLVALFAVPSGIAAPTDLTLQLQEKVERIVLHLGVRKRTRVMSAQEYGERYVVVGQALDVWNKAQRTEQDVRLMDAWLDQAIEASRLGGTGNLPPAPQLSVRAPEPEPVELPAPVEAPVPLTQAQPPAIPELAPQPTVVVERPPSEPRLIEPAPQPAVAEPWDEAPFAPAPIEPLAEEPSPPTTPVAPTETRPAPQPQKTWADHPAAGQLDWGDPFADDAPVTLANDTTSAKQKRFKPISQQQGVKVDLLELSSRAAGYNSQLRQLEGLLLGSRELTAFRLASIVRDLDELHEQQDFLQLYFAALSEEEKSLGPELDSADALLNMLDEAAKKRAESLENASGNQASAEQAILGALERKLADLRLDFDAER